MARSEASACPDRSPVARQIAKSGGLTFREWMNARPRATPSSTKRPLRYQPSFRGSALSWDRFLARLPPPTNSITSIICTGDDAVILNRLRHTGRVSPSLLGAALSDDSFSARLAPSTQHLTSNIRKQACPLCYSCTQMSHTQNMMQSTKSKTQVCKVTRDSDILRASTTSSRVVSVPTSSFSEKARPK